MINFRFHLISLVAVFLALAVGVAMGASFVDRATVETLRDRVDALDDGYRQRGDELQSVTEQLESSDSQAAALAGEGSRALTGALAETPVVLVTGDGVPGDVVDATRSSLAAAGAIDSGTLRLQPALALSDSDVLRRTRERFGVRSRDRAEVGERVVEDLGAALALLAADPAEQTTTTAPPVGPDGAPLPTDPGAGGAPSTDTPTTAAPTTATPAGVARPTDPASARAVLEAAVELGLVAVDAGAAPAVVTVAEAHPSRADGSATTTTAGEPPRGESLAALREGDLAEVLSTVDDLDESFGRIALVYAVAEHADGLVGHYGTGVGAQAPFPTVPAG